MLNKESVYEGNCRQRQKRSIWNSMKLTIMQTQPEKNRENRKEQHPEKVTCGVRGYLVTFALWG
jgi:hypothetical protein